MEHPSLLDDRINVRGFFERILQERDKIEDEREKRLNERFRAQETALAAALAERDRSLAAALSAAKEAVDKAEKTNDKKFDNANEWRGQSADRERTQQEQLATFGATLLPRETFAAFQTVHDESVRRLESFHARILGALAFAIVVIPGITALAVYAATKGAP